ncbi:hypothetical protein TWF696_005932 [Orbilia brochopaga]|uniref:Uncharacterized protein n=1 Tax=Orbilia brochopaga TaxID=3140254 RepID=A0AAV9UW11_9PEZI
MLGYSFSLAALLLAALTSDSADGFAVPLHDDKNSSLSLNITTDASDTARNETALNISIAALARRTKFDLKKAKMTKRADGSTINPALLHIPIYIGASAFYKYWRSMAMRCDMWSDEDVLEGGSWVVDMDPGPPAGMTWPDLGVIDLDEARALIRSKRERCESCECDENGTPRPASVTIAGHSNCPDLVTVAECIFIYGCMCTAELASHPSESGRRGRIPPGATNEEIQKGIDRIPGWLQALNPNWSFRFLGRTFTWSKAVGAAIATTAKQAVEGVAEPYYLEGPSTSKEDWGWLAGLGSTAFKRIANAVAPGQLRAGRRGGHRLIPRSDSPHPGAGETVGEVTPGSGTDAPGGGDTTS